MENKKRINTKSNDELQKKKNNREMIKNNLDEKTKIKLWIRTLLYSYKTLPKIIDTIDKLVISRASEYAFSSSIFNYTNRLENQFNVLINMTERKDKIINIHVMTKNLLNSLSKEKYEIIYKKFCELQTNEEIASNLGVSVRTIFRKIADIIEKMYYFTVKNNWTLKFIESQVKRESWLIERYNKNIDEYVIDSYK